MFVGNDERFLIGSNDLHRFWENYYVGHADNMKNFRDADKMLHPLCIVRCSSHHGSSSGFARAPLSELKRSLPVPLERLFGSSPFAGSGILLVRWTELDPAD